MPPRHAYCLLALVLAPLQAQAEIFAHPHKGYAVETPGGWHLAHPDFMLMSSTGASLSESDLPAHGPRSLERISKTAGMIACIGADYRETDEHFPITGENWNGLVSVFEEPRRANRLPRHVLQLVTQHGDHFRLFYLAVPSREWIQDRAPFKTLLARIRYQ